VMLLGSCLALSTQTLIQQNKDVILARWGLSELESLYLVNSTRVSTARLVARLVEKITIKEKFVMTFTGTSITVGRDSYVSQAYPEVFRSQLAPVFASLGIELVVSNAAQGLNPVVPYNLCLETFVGDDNDVVSWEQLHMCQTPHLCVEDFVRRTSMLPNNPIPIVIDALTNPLSSGKTFSIYKDLFSKVNGSMDLLQHYQELGLHFVLGMFAISENSENQRFSFDNLMQNGKLLKTPHPFHPGPHGHQLIADILSLHYMTAIEKAVTMLNQNAGSLASLKFSSILPQMLWKSEQIFSRIPQCITSYEPKQMKRMELSLYLHNSSFSSLMMLNRDDHLLEIKSPKHFFNVLSREAWNLNLWPIDVSGVSKSLKYEAGYLDRKYTLSAVSTAGSLHLDLTFREPGPLIICEPRPPNNIIPRGFSLVSIFDAVVAEVDSIPLNLSQYAGSHCLISDNFLDSGRHVLSLKSIAESRFFGISHIIFP